MPRKKLLAIVAWFSLGHANPVMALRTESLPPSPCLLASISAGHHVALPVDSFQASQPSSSEARELTKNTQDQDELTLAISLCSSGGPSKGLPLAPARLWKVR